jgi:hypothetical protein
MRSVPGFPEEWRPGARDSKHTLDNPVDLPTQNDRSALVGRSRRHAAGHAADGVCRPVSGVPNARRSEESSNIGNSHGPPRPISPV